MKESLKKTKTINVTQFEKNKTTFILCDCKNEVLVIEYDEQCKMADFAIYESYKSYSLKMSFWQKMRYIWHILAHNQPYNDQILLNCSQLKQLNSFLNSLKLN